MAPSLNAAQDAGLGALRVRRVRRMLELGSAIAGAIGIGWGLFFALRGSWLVASAELASIIVTALALGLTRQGRLRLASFVLTALLFVLICFGATVLDLPTSAHPRSIHQFLLSLGVASCVLMRDERPLVRHGVPLLYLLSYAVFACTAFGFDSGHAIPESVRASGTWINQVLALVLLYTALHVMQNDVAERSALEGELRSAIVRGEMSLHFQPQLSAEGRVVGAEALLRWQHPRRGLVSPAEFIPLAERNGLMLALGDWVLRSACAQLASWSRQPQMASLRLAINVSASQFAQAGFVDGVIACVKGAGIDPGRLKLELTESMLAHDIDDVIRRMQALKAHGIGLSLDDFGTGFSSLSYLRQLPLDQLKIDQSFVRNMLGSAKDLAIARTVISLGENLGMEVIAEGIETWEQHRRLLGLGCRMFQGYLFSRPLPIEQFDAFVQQQHQPAPAGAAVSKPAAKSGKALSLP